MEQKYWINSHPAVAGFMIGVLTVVMIPLVIVLLADIGVI